MNDEELNTIAKIEKAIVEKYGREALYDPVGNWNPEKEKKYLEEIKQLSTKERKIALKTIRQYEINGVLVEDGLYIKENVERVCPECEEYSFDSKDDIYMKRYSCCQKCYYQWVDGREERWLSGWRPRDKKRGDK
jgi:hypothetical protein